MKKILELCARIDDGPKLSGNQNIKTPMTIVLRTDCPTTSETLLSEKSKPITKTFRF